MDADLWSQRRYLWIGARSVSQPLQLREVLRFLHHLECEDARDRIYGVLSLIDWYQGRVPVPDYDKDAFVIAKDIIELLHLEKPCDSGSRCWYIYSLFGAAQRVSIALLNFDDPLFLRAVRLRQQPISRHQESVSNPLRPRVADAHWYGARIGDIFTMKPCERYTELWSDEISEEKTPILFAPQGTQSLDWILTEYDSPMEDGYPLKSKLNIMTDDTMLVVRMSQDCTCYAILGAAYRASEGNATDIIKTRVEFFLIYWDSEDLLVHNWRAVLHGINITLFDRWEIYFGQRFSAIEGASYARGPFSISEMRDIVKDESGAALLERPLGCRHF